MGSPKVRPITVDKTTYLTRNLILNVLKHHEFDPVTEKFILDAICQILVPRFGKKVRGLPFYDMLAYILLLLDVRYICRFAQTFHVMVDTAGRDRKKRDLNRLIRQVSEVTSFPELFENPLLLPEEATRFQTIFFRRFNSLKISLHNLFETDHLVLTGVASDGISRTFAECYRDVCQVETKDILDLQILRQEDIYDHVYFLDRAKEMLLPRVCFYEIRKLIPDLKRNWNRYLGCPFSPAVYRNLTTRFATELKMNEWFNQLMDA